MRFIFPSPSCRRRTRSQATVHQQQHLWLVYWRMAMWHRRRPIHPQQLPQRMATLSQHASRRRTRRSSSMSRKRARMRQGQSSSSSSSCLTSTPRMQRIQRMRSLTQMVRHVNYLKAQVTLCVLSDYLNLCACSWYLYLFACSGYPCLYPISFPFLLLQLNKK